MKKIILIPSYEPDDKLVKLINSIDTKEFIVIVVNDGSNENYDKIFDKIKDKVYLISYKKNKGKGYALKEGFKYIKDNYNEYIVITMDSDGQHKISDAKKLLEYILNHRDTLVIGSRKRNKKIPLRSKFGSEVSSLTYKLVTGINIYDTQSGLRAFSNELMDFIISIDGNRFEYEMNVLMLASKNNIKMKEIEIETIYIDNNKKSHFNPLIDSYKVYKEILKYSCASFLSFIIDYLLFSILSIFLNFIYSNIFARIISCNINYILNKKVVFNSKKSRNSYIKYILLAIIILIINTIFLNTLIANGLNIYLSKILVEISLYILSYVVQKYIIFQK